MKTKVSTFTLAKFDSDSSMDTEGGSEDEGRRGHEDVHSTTRMKPSISFVFDKFDREEKDIIKGIFPGNDDQSLTSRFVAYHFAGVRDDYYFLSVGRSSSADKSCLPDLDSNVEGSKHVEGRTGTERI